MRPKVAPSHLRLDVLEDIRVDFEADAENEDTLLAKRGARWEAACVLTFMLQSRSEALRIPTEVREAPCLQRRIVRVWAGAEPNSGLRDWVRRRAGHLVRAKLVEGEVDLVTRRMRWPFNE